MSRDEMKAKLMELMTEEEAEAILAEVDSSRIGLGRSADNSVQVVLRNGEYRGMRLRRKPSA